MKASLNFCMLENFRMAIGKVYVILTLGCFMPVMPQFIYLNSGVVKFIAGIGLPVNIHLSGSSASFFTNFQAFYNLPDNITYFEPYKIIQKRSVKSTFNRPTLYQALLKYFESSGISRLGIFGKECIHRMICEVASREINRDENGLLGEIIHIFFSPWEDSQEDLEEYKKAQWQGLHNGSDCGILYKDCFVAENSIFLI